MSSPGRSAGQAAPVTATRLGLLHGGDKGNCPKTSDREPSVEHHTLPIDSGRARDKVEFSESGVCLGFSPAGCGIYTLARWPVGELSASPARNRSVASGV